MADLKKAELYIQQTCEKHFINLDDLKSQRYGGGLGDIKREVVSTLYHDYKLTQKQIAQIFVKSENAIWQMLQHKTNKEQMPKDSQTSLQKPDLSHITKNDTVIPDKNIIYFSFKDHTDLYKYLIKTSKANFRKPEDHILYLINKEREGSDEEQHTFHPDTESL